MATETKGPTTGAPERVWIDVSGREQRLEDAFKMAFQALACISRGVGKGRSNVHGRLTAAHAKAVATKGVEQALRALAGQGTRALYGDKKIGLSPVGRDVASDVLRAVGWMPTPGLEHKEEP